MNFVPSIQHNHNASNAATATAGGFYPSRAMAMSSGVCMDGNNQMVDGSQGGDGAIKYTCRYDIQIPNEREFQVARRLIGAKGSNMKRIIQ